MERPDEREIQRATREQREQQRTGHLPRAGGEPGSPGPGRLGPDHTSAPAPPAGPPAAGPGTGSGPGTGAGPATAPGTDPAAHRPAGRTVTTDPAGQAPGGDRSQPRAGGGGVLPQSEKDELALRLQHAVTGFVDGPRRSVEEADALFEEVASRFTESLAERRRALRTAWHGTEADGGTEELRTALRDYRDLVERLMRA